MEKREKATAQSNEMDELVCKACALEGCDKGMRCFGGSVNGLCVEAIAQYNELRKKELVGAKKEMEKGQEGSGDLSKKEPIGKAVFKCLVCGEEWDDDFEFASEGEEIVKSICEECSKQGYFLTATDTGEVVAEKEAVNE